MPRSAPEASERGSRVTRVLVVDDEPQILRALRINLRVRDYDVHVAATGAEALEVAGRYPPDLVILDLGLPDLDGVEVIQGLRGWTQGADYRAVRSSRQRGQGGGARRRRR